jgi:glyoxylase-like metal-dependent hydrolase (beta-lactamase superfamily II)
MIKLLPLDRRTVRTLAAVTLLSVSQTGTSAPRDSMLLESRVHSYASGEAGIFANAYLVDVGTGVVAIDATLSVSDSKKLRAHLDEMHKPLLAVLLTHGHPDHYNGVTALVEGYSIPIVATAAVDRVIREWDARKESQWKPVFKEEWPAVRTFPNRIVRDGESLKYGVVSFTVRDLGPGESHADSYWIARNDDQRIAFIGDLSFNGFHSYLADGHTAEWLANLRQARQKLATFRMLYPGHGAAGGIELLEAEERYLQKYRQSVASVAPGRPSLSDAEKGQLVDAMSAYLPDGKLAFLIPLGADAVAAEMSAATKAR